MIRAMMLLNFSRAFCSYLSKHLYVRSRLHELKTWILHLFTFVFFSSPTERFIRCLACVVTWKFVTRVKFIQFLVNTFLSLNWAPVVLESDEIKLRQNNCWVASDFERFVPVIIAFIHWICKLKVLHWLCWI